MANFFGERRGREDEGEMWNGVGGRRQWRIQHVGLCCRDMCYLRVQRSLFAGHRGIDFLSMSAALFRAQHRGDKSKLIHCWIWINIQTANINSHPKRGNAECVKMLTQIRNKDPWPKIPSRVFHMSALFLRVPQSHLCMFAFCVNLHNDFL